jgi:plastocyanin
MAELATVDNDFEPICIGVAPGQDLEVVNEGGLPHTFTYEDGDIDVTLSPGDHETVEGFGDLLPSGEEVQFHCTIHPSMVGYANLVES